MPRDIILQCIIADAGQPYPMPICVCVPQIRGFGAFSGRYYNHRVFSCDERRRKRHPQLAGMDDQVAGSPPSTSLRGLPRSVVNLRQQKLSHQFKVSTISQGAERPFRPFHRSIRPAGKGAGLYLSVPQTPGPGRRDRKRTPLFYPGYGNMGVP